MRRVAITGLGVVSPVGVGTTPFFESLLSGRSGIRRLSAPFAGQLSIRIGAEVDFDPAVHFAKPRLAMLDRYSQLAIVAANEAIADAGMILDDELRDATGVFIGTSVGGTHTLEDGYDDLFRSGKDRLPPFTVLRAMNNAAAAHISIDHGLHGQSSTYSTACSSSAMAIGEAFRAIRHGYVRAAVAGGAESMLSYGTMRAWEALRTLASEDAADVGASCRPFSKDRTGLVLGEGAAMLMLEDMEQAVKRGAHILAEMAGYGVSSDATHMARPDKAGQVRAMRAALADARLSGDTIGYVNAHGTATPAGDVIETAAIKDVFGGHAEMLAVSSTKSMHGHLMGAAGAVEFVATVLAIRNGAIPPTANLREADPECDLDYVPNTARHGLKLRAAMSNSFAFGGCNAVLIAKGVE